MFLDSKKLLEFLNNSTDEKVELDKSFFISIIELIDKTNNIKVEEMYSNNRFTYINGSTTIISSAELLSESSLYGKLTGEVKVEVTELKELLRDNLRMSNKIKELHSIKKELEKNLAILFYSDLKEKEKVNPYNNNMGSDIKICIKG